MFSPGAAIKEDAATGSAAVIPAAQLLANSALAEGTTRMTIRQGKDMGRPSLINFEAEVTSSRIVAVLISRRSMPVAEGRIRIPA